MKNKLRNLYWFLSNQLGIDLRRLTRSLLGAPRYLRDLAQFRKAYGKSVELQPCLYDWFEEGGATKSEYFLQDLHIAQKIHQHNPQRHVDIGSRIDGFVANVASFREIEVFDIRPVSSTLPHITFRQADLMNPAHGFLTYCDSLSCLHALEHFGLGRYGDTLDPLGSEKGLQNIAKIIRPNGYLYLSVPVGIEKIRFNAHRIFDPRALATMAKKYGLSLRDFSYIGASKTIVHSTNWDTDFQAIATQTYALGIFTFVRDDPSVP